MRKINFLFFLYALFFYQCDNDSDNIILFSDITISRYGNIKVNEGDTIPILKYQRLRYKARSENSEFTWDFGDNTIEYGNVVYHEYNENGIFIVTTTKNNTSFNFYVKVCGYPIIESEEKYQGIFLSRVVGSEKYIVTYGENRDEFFIHKYFENEELSCVELEGFDSRSLKSISMDSEGNFIMLMDNSFSKVNTDAVTLYSKNFQNLSTQGWDFNENSSNDYSFSGINSEAVFLEKRNVNGELIESLRFNAVENNGYKNKHCTCINENEYLLLQYRKDSSNVPQSVKLINQNFLSRGTTKLVIPESFYSNIFETESGFLLYGFDYSTEGNATYLNLAKVSFELDIEWTYQIPASLYVNYYMEYSDDYININNKNFTSFIETAESYLLFYTNKVLIINKTIESLQKIELFDPDFNINDVSLINENRIEILGTLENEEADYYSTKIVKSPVLVSINNVGELID